MFANIVQCITYFQLLPVEAERSFQEFFFKNTRNLHYDVRLGLNTFEHCLINNHQKFG